MLILVRFAEKAFSLRSRRKCASRHPLHVFKSYFLRRCAEHCVVSVFGPLPRLAALGSDHLGAPCMIFLSFVALFPFVHFAFFAIFSLTQNCQVGGFVLLSEHRWRRVAVCLRRGPLPHVIDHRAKQLQDKALVPGAARLLMPARNEQTWQVSCSRPSWLALADLHASV